MSKSEKSKSTDAEKALFLEREKERELKQREARLAQHRAHLEEQMHIRRDYYSLGMVHKMIIFGLFLMLSSFVTFLILSYFPPTKDKVFELLKLVI